MRTENFYEFCFILLQISILASKTRGDCTGPFVTRCPCPENDGTTTGIYHEVGEVAATVENICSPSFYSATSSWAVKAGTEIKVEAWFRPNRQIDAMSISMATTVCGFPFSLATVNDICDPHDLANDKAAGCPLRANDLVSHKITVAVPIYVPWEAINITVTGTRLIKPELNSEIKSEPMFCLTIDGLEITSPL